MINDVTYLMDESLSELTQIHNIQVEMDDQATWNSKPSEYRREREMTLRSLERHASGYTTLCRSTVELLKVFTAETKAPFMMPEIVDRLAAMLDYNLQALVGPKYQGLKVREPEKLKFSPRELLGDVIQVYLNLSDQPQFIQAVAGDGRSYSKELFKSAVEIGRWRTIKSETEIVQLQAFADKVEEAKSALTAEEDLGELPDEFLGMDFHSFDVLNFYLFLTTRSIDVHCNAGSSIFAIIQDHSRPRHDKVSSVVRLERPI
jgi:ubiquitin conjugation factor E4 B